MIPCFLLDSYVESVRRYRVHTQHRRNNELVIFSFHGDLHIQANRIKGVNVHDTYGMNMLVTIVEPKDRYFEVNLTFELGSKTLN